MKRNIIASVLFLFVMIDCYSQKEHAENMLSASIGPAFPVGNYAKKDIDNNAAGFAKAGEQINILFDHKLGGIAGVSAMLYGIRNPINTGAFEQQFNGKKFYEGFYFYDPNQPPPAPQPVMYPNWKFDKASWLNAGLVLGPYIDIPFNKIKNNLFFTAKAMAGVMYVSSPKLTGTSTTDTAMARVTQSSVSAFGFSYLLGAGVKYNTAKNICIHAGIDYLGSNQIKFKDVKESFSAAKTSNGLPATYSSSTTGTEKQHIALLNINVGIGLRL